MIPSPSWKLLIRTMLPGQCAICQLLTSSLLLLPLLLNLAQGQNSDVRSLIDSGQNALDAGDFVHAARSFEAARQLSPENLEVTRGLLLAYLQSGMLADAENVGVSAVARWPRDAQLQHWTGLVYFKKGRTPKALELLQRAENLDGSRYDIHFDVALALLAENQYSAAAHELETAVRLNRKEALAHVLLGRTYQNTNRTVQAIEQFSTALRLDPNIPLGHYHLAFAYASLGRNQEAIAEYQKELVRSPDNPSVLYQLGHCLIDAGEYASAATNLKRAVQIDPQNLDASYDLGKVLLLQGDADAAVPALRRAVELKPTDPSRHYQLARALEKTGRKEEAQQEFRAFSELKRTQPETGGMAAGPIR
jgi:tetratricopeptide (TPR) repeat protein